VLIAHGAISCGNKPAATTGLLISP